MAKKTDPKDKMPPKMAVKAKVKGKSVCSKCAKMGKTSCTH